jgi:imidazolonepropionase-like amidohydrolase
MALVLHGGTLIDGTGADPRPKSSIAIDGETIWAMRESAAPKRDRHVIDCSDLTILPGLIDAHSHLGLAAATAEFSGERSPGLTPAAEIAASIFRNCELCLDAGFTTVRDMAGLDGGVARAVERGLVRGPRIFPSGAALVQLGGHAHMSGPFAEQDVVCAIPGLAQMITICNGADEVRVAARKNFRRGATQLKAFISGGVVSSTDRLEDTQLTIEELRAAVLEAQARESYVAGHAHNTRAIANGLAAGLSCFEHGTFLDEATAAAMAKAGAALDPTLAVCHLMANEYEKWGLPSHVVPRIAGCEVAMNESMKIALAAGVLVGSGSDLLGPEQNRRGLEVTLKAKSIGAMQAIVAATRNNARIMRQDQRLGTIEEGKLADVIAIRGDPLAHPEIFDDPDSVVLVIKGGVVVKNWLEKTLKPDGQRSISQPLVSKS